MTRFAMQLHDLSERLRLPQPARSRILLEISGDLEALFRMYVERGLPEEEAEREALSRVDLSDDALEELCGVHGGWLRRFTEVLAHRAGPVGERLVLVSLALGAVALSGVLLHALPMARAAGPWLLPVGLAALATLGVGAWKAWGLLVIGDQRPARLRAGLDGILGLSVLQVFTAFGALWITALGAYRSVARGSPQAGLLTMHWLQSSLALLIVSSSLAILGSLVWFFLLMKVVSIEHREATALLEGWDPGG